jgi:hypothetical protein
MCWATFWAIFSQTHLVTLLLSSFLRKTKKIHNKDACFTEAPQSRKPRCRDSNQRPEASANKQQPHVFSIYKSKLTRTIADLNLLPEDTKKLPRPLRYNADL